MKFTGHSELILVPKKLYIQSQIPILVFCWFSSTLATFNPMKAEGPYHKISPLLAAVPSPPCLGAAPIPVVESWPFVAYRYALGRFLTLYPPRTARSSGVSSCFWKIIPLVLFRVQLVESLYNDAVDFLKIIYVPSLSC